MCKSEKNQEPSINISDIMSHAVECYKYIDEYGKKMDKVCSNKIQPLLDEHKYKEAKKAVREFFEPSRYPNKNGDDIGDPVFIEYDLILANINRLEREYKLN